jgi:hypothetical protein
VGVARTRRTFFIGLNGGRVWSCGERDVGQSIATKMLAGILWLFLLSSFLRSHNFSGNWGQCYDHNFLRFLINFLDGKMAILLKTNVRINFWHKIGRST